MNPVNLQPCEDRDATPPDGQPAGACLALARQAQGLDRAVVARRLAVSVRQLQQIEEGGLEAFYGEQHKKLLIRKYADFLGCPVPPDAGLPPGGAG